MGSARVGDTRARQIAKDLSITGKGVEGLCLPFARALHAKFQAAGIPSKIVCFRYTTLAVPIPLVENPSVFPSVAEQGGTAGEHAVVVYEDEGRTYVMDNQSWQPTWVHDSSPTSVSQQFSGMNVAIAGVRVLGDAGAMRQRLACNVAGRAP